MKTNKLNLGMKLPTEKDMLNMSKKKLEFKDTKVKLPEGKVDTLPKDMDKKVKSLF